MTILGGEHLLLFCRLDLSVFMGHMWGTGDKDMDWRKVGSLIKMNNNILGKRLNQEIKYVRGSYNEESAGLNLG